MTRDRVSQVGLTVLVLCAVVTTGISLVRYLTPGPRPFVRQDHRLSDSLWKMAITSGRRIGPSSARTTIVEFADFECPACRQFALSSVAPMLRQHPHDFAVIFHNWPLPYHHLAYPAARAAECAAQQGRFIPFYNLLYAGQDSLGIKPFAAYAAQSGVSDTTAFRGCVGQSGPVATIADDVALAQLIGGQGTPTVLVDGVVLGTVPDSAALERLIRRQDETVPGRRSPE